MLDWAQLVLVALKLAVLFQSWVTNRQSYDAGKDRAIAEGALEVLERTEYGRALRQKIREMDDPAADALWEEMIKVETTDGNSK